MDERFRHLPLVPLRLSRRRLLAGAASAAALALSPDALWAAVRSGTSGAQATPAVLTLLDAVCDHVIPATDTPGATQARVPEFVVLAIAHRLAGAEPAAAERLALELDRRAGQAFLDCNVDRQIEILQSLDAEAFSDRGSSTTVDAVAIATMASGRALADWRAIKALIVIGYYTSEPGATRELRYEFVPGRYDADLPIKPGDRALMNDWWGNTF